MAEYDPELDRAEIREDFGVNETVAEEIRVALQEEPLGGFWSAIVHFTTYGTLIGGVGLGAVWVWPFLEGLYYQKRFEYAADVGGLLVTSNFGFGLLAWLFAWILLTPVPAALVVLFFPIRKRLQVAATAFSEGDSKMFARPALADVAEGGGSIESADEFARRWAARVIAKSLSIASLPGALGAFVLYAEMTSIHMYTAEKAVIDPFLPFQPIEEYFWEDADEVSLGCKRYKEDGDTIIYKVTFGDKTWSLGRADPTTDLDVISSLEVINEAIERGGATFVRATHRGGELLEQKCLRGFYGELGRDESHRLDDLLKVGEL